MQGCPTQKISLGNLEVAIIRQWQVPNSRNRHVVHVIVTRSREGRLERVYKDNIGYRRKGLGQGGPLNLSRSLGMAIQLWQQAGERLSYAPKQTFRTASSLPTFLLTLTCNAPGAPIKTGTANPSAVKLKLQQLPTPFPSLAKQSATSPI